MSKVSKIINTVNKTEIIDNNRYVKCKKIINIAERIEIIEISKIANIRNIKDIRND